MPFTVKEVFQHSMLGYYLLLLTARHCMAKYGKLWSRYYIPKQTLRNMCFVAVHAIIATLNWPESLPWRPQARNEAACEHHFSAIKQFFRGEPTVKDAILGSHYQHLQEQSRNASFRSSPCKGKKVKALSHAEAEVLAEDCLVKACNFMSWICIDEDPAEIRKSFASWWTCHGPTFFSTDADVDVDDGFLEAEPDDLEFDDLDKPVEDIDDFQFLQELGLDEIQHGGDGPDIAELSDEQKLFCLEDRSKIQSQMEELQSEVLKAAEVQESGRASEKMLGRQHPRFLSPRNQIQKTTG